ncbi:nucleotide sugar dehydrogenase [Desulfoplanes formicivorans]|uniref:GDP-mannose dehydrogenase n=1 Tax=Desulfoplanes formicivorans TaxID=1592317 RepID=A0A194ADP3_9BACT|nr:nucleotide sugar dehydrogenase [Desulfoplanes formicivorans]GAU08197.1 GDP-mannose dehydrogenase [Desulfoplanes formicivorans]
MLTYDDLADKKVAVAVIGLGYVGLPLAVAFAEHFDVIGFDINEGRVAELRAGRDRTLEVDNERLQQADMEFTSDPAAIERAGVIVVAVPTPIDRNRRPDLTPVVGASTVVGKHLRRGSIVVYESTVYPGVTEEVCGPILERESGLVCGKDFFLGYSPERINPGDKVHTLQTITKIVAGQTPEVADLLGAFYGRVVAAGTHRASSIRVAEAAKVIENTQRDLNIALMNELSHIFAMMGIDTLEVLEAAGTKWNFLPFRPGLVGGHCIGVDPYYLTFKAEELGYHPQVILSGRRINDSMGSYVAQTMIKKMIHCGCTIKGARVGIMGLTFKENCPDLRNTRVIDIVAELREFGCEVVVHDPYADALEARREYGIEMQPWETFRDLDGLIIAVAHDAYKKYRPKDLLSVFRPRENNVVADIKGMLDRDQAKAHGLTVWRL